MMLMAGPCLLSCEETGWGNSGSLSGLTASAAAEFRLCECTAELSGTPLEACYVNAGGSGLGAACGFAVESSDPIAREAIQCFSGATAKYAECLQSRTCDELVDEFTSSFPCADGSDIIALANRCDGTAECDDLSDERFCDAGPPTCAGAYTLDQRFCPVGALSEAALSGCFVFGDL